MQSLKTTAGLLRPTPRPRDDQDQPGSREDIRDHASDEACQHTCVQLQSPASDTACFAYTQGFDFCYGTHHDSARLPGRGIYEFVSLAGAANGVRLARRMTLWGIVQHAVSHCFLLLFRGGMYMYMDVLVIMFVSMLL